MKVWKLTDAYGCTYGNPETPTPLQWGPGVEHTAPGNGPLCTAAWVHAYVDPFLAVLLDPVGANFGLTARLWEAEGDIGAENLGLKVGCVRLKTVREVPLPQITLEQRIRFGILCVKEVFTDPAWNAWADNWLSGRDRSGATARAAMVAADGQVGEAAKAAADAAEAAWVVAVPSRPPWVVNTVADAVANAATSAAEAAVRAVMVLPAMSAREAAEAASLDLPALARRAMEET